MGVLRKSPNQKVKIDPAKFWGGITLFALFAAGTFYLLRPEETIAQGSTTPTPEQEVAAGFDQQHHDPNCRPIKQGVLVDGELEGEDPEAGLVRICGRIVSSRIHPHDLDGDSSIEYRGVQDGIDGAMVAVYESDPEAKNGKSFYGNLVHLFSSSQANEDGFFQLHTRGLGPKSNHVYVVTYCNGEYMGGQRIHSMRHLSNLQIAVDCDPTETYNYSIPYGSVVIVDRLAKIQECVTNVAQKLVDEITATDIPMRLSVNRDKVEQISVGGPIKEENYDFRYVTQDDAKSALNVGGGGGGGILGFLDDWISGVLEGGMFEETVHSDGNRNGALWANDCYIANGKGGFGDDLNMSNIGPVDVATLGKNDLAKDTWVCSSKGMSEEYNIGEDGYLVNTALRFIPEKEELLAWRRLDNRVSFKQSNQYPFANRQAMGAIFGDYVGRNQYIYKPDNAEEADKVGKLDKFMICEDIERSSDSYNVINHEDEYLYNTKLTASFGSMLSSPGLWREYLNLGIPEGELDDLYCLSEDGGFYTIRMVLEDPELRKRWLRPENYLPKGSGDMPWNNETTNDACFQDLDVRKEGLEVFKTEAEQHCHDQTRTVLPEGMNRTGSTVAAQYTTGELGIAARIAEENPTLPENIYTGLDSPYGDDTDAVEKYLNPPEAVIDADTGEEIVLEINSVGDKPAPVYSLGNILTAACGVSEVYGLPEFGRIFRDFGDNQLEELDGTLHNFFLGNIDHLRDEVVSSGGYYTEDSIKRDALLKPENGAPGQDLFGEGPAKNRDVFDSVLEMAASEDKIDFANVGVLDILSAKVGSILGGLAGDPLKSLGERQSFDVDGIPRKVYYPLNAENFKSFFPAWPGAAGGHPDYGEWVDLKGGVCDVWPGVGQNPEGQIRTCKIDSCRWVSLYWEYDFGVRDWVEKQDIKGCTRQDEIEVLTEQRDTTNVDLKYLPAPLPTSIRVADLSVNHGPYNYIAPYEQPMRVRMEQDDLVGETYGIPATPMDKVSSVADRFRQSFQSPEEEGNIAGGHVTQVDYEYSKNQRLRPVDGYDSRGYGFDPASSGLHAIAASPTSSSVRKPLDDIKYHCWMTFKNMDGSPRNNPVTNDKLPVYQPAGGNPVIPIYGPMMDVWPEVIYGINDVDYYWECPVRPFVIGECTTDAFDRIPGGIDVPLPEALEYFQLYTLTEKLAVYPELLEAYGFASANTGVPCEILAGIHHMEGSSNPDQSLLDGHPISPSDLPEDALTAAEHLVTKLGGKKIQTLKFQDYVKALDYYNGPGNQNCYDPRTPWCPAPRGPKFYGEDHPYPMSWMDGDHGGLEGAIPMYIKYCYDGIFCDSSVDGTDDSGFLPMMRPGAIAIAKALNMYLGGQ